MNIKILNIKCFHKFPSSLNSLWQLYQLEKLEEVPDLLIVFVHSRLESYLEPPFSYTVIPLDKYHL